MWDKFVNQITIRGDCKGIDELTVYATPVSLHIFSERNFPPVHLHVVSALPALTDSSQTACWGQTVVRHDAERKKRI